VGNGALEVQPQRHQMKPEYREGIEARENFEQAMKVLFRPKIRSKKKQQKDKPTAALRKPKNGDKG
jgi:hypothetical protein